MKKNSSISTRFTPKTQQLLALAAGLSLEQEQKISDLCIESALLEHVPAAVRNEADRYAAWLCRDLEKLLASSPKDNGSGKPTSMRLSAAVIYAMGEISDYKGPEDYQTLRSTGGVSRSEVITYSIESQIVKVCKEVISKRLQIGDSETARKFRKTLHHRRQWPEKYFPLMPMEMKPVDGRRWKAFLDLMSSTALQTKGKSNVSPTKRHPRTSRNLKFQK